MKLSKITALVLCACVSFSFMGCTKNYDGDYVATYDFTDEFNKSLDDSIGDGTTDNFTGSVEFEFNLTLDDGEYTIELSEDSVKDSIASYMNENIDELLMSMSGATSVDDLETVAVNFGFDSYDDLRDNMLSSISDSFENQDFSANDEGEFDIKKDTIEFTSDDSDDFEGTIEDDIISVSLPLNDDSLGIDELELEFVPADDENSDGNNAAESEAQASDASAVSETSASLGK